MWGPSGRAYVYLCYGIHNMLNVVAHPEGGAGAVLIRSCRALAGLDLVRARRGGREGPGVLAGPGKVGAALALDVSWSHHPLTEPGGLEIRAGSSPAVVTGSRVGIDYAQEADRRARLRFARAECREVSHRRGLAPG
jgi:DNA-3-methyladenine glycosylase